MSTRSHQNKPKAEAASKNIAKENSMTDTSSLFHPRNRHQGKYDFEQLMDADKAALKEDLAGFTFTNTAGEISINFSDAKAIKALKPRPTPAAIWCL